MGMGNILILMSTNNEQTTLVQLFKLCSSVNVRKLMGALSVSCVSGGDTSLISYFLLMGKVLAVT